MDIVAYLCITIGARLRVIIAGRRMLDQKLIFDNEVLLAGHIAYGTMQKPRQRSIDFVELGCDTTAAGHVQAFQQFW